MKTEIVTCPDLILIRGLPGSGKTTLAKTMMNRVHLETDKFFTLLPNGTGGRYTFDPSKLPEAHRWCMAKTQAALKADLLVVVSNTFTQLWEMEPYFTMCKELGKTFKVIEATGTYQNIHDVPAKSIEKMKARWEPYEPA